MSAAQVGIRPIPPARWLFESKPASSIWLVARLWLGYEWVRIGWSRVFGASRDGWMSSGDSLRTSAEAALERARDAEPALAYWWYTGLLDLVGQNAAWIAPALAVAGLVTGAAVLLGAFTGLAAFLGIIVHFSTAFAGGLDASPALILVALLLVLAWRNAGYQGLDRLLLWALREREAPRPPVPSAEESLVIDQPPRPPALRATETAESAAAEFARRPQSMPVRPGEQGTTAVHAAPKASGEDAGGAQPE